MLLFKKDLTPYKSACFSDYKLLAWREANPLKLYWAIRLKYTRKELTDLLSKIKFQTTELFPYTNEALYHDSLKPDTFVFGGNYPSFANLLIEGGLIRLLAENDHEEHDGYSYQHWLRDKIYFENAKLLSDLHSEQHKSNILNGGHSPFSDIDLTNAPYTINDYIECSTQTPFNYIYNCSKTFELLQKKYK